MSLVIGERHPQRVRAKYVDYYNGTRVQRDARAPAEDAPEPQDSAVAEPGTMVEVPRVGGLHHETAGGRSQDLLLPPR